MSTSRTERRVRDKQQPIGRRSEAPEGFGRSFAGLASLAQAGVQVSMRATDLATGRVLMSIDDHVVMPLSTVGAVLLLIEVAGRLKESDATGDALLERPTSNVVTESGIWGSLRQSSLHMTDLAVLVGATGDPLATNALIEHVGLEAVRARGVTLGLNRTALMDIVRDRRGPDDAPQLSVGSARELTWLFAALARGEVISPEVSQRVIGWLSLNTDLSMVAAAFGLNPAGHHDRDHGILLVNSTGADIGVRSEVGVLRGPRASAAYTVSMAYPETDLTQRLAVLEGMRGIGMDILEYVH